MRISIIGFPGSGKSTAADKIGEKLNIPCLHIDRFWFEAGGHKLKRGDLEGEKKVRQYIREKVQNFIKQDSWVSDGWYSRVQPLIAERADQILFLNISIPQRLINHAKRVMQGNRNRELTRWDDIKFFYQIIRRTFTYTPKIKEFIRNNPSKIKIFGTYKELNHYIKDLQIKTETL